MSSHKDPVFSSASELLARYRTKSLSPVEVTEAVLKRISALNPKLNAYCVVDPDSALMDAHASEVRWTKGIPQGWLDGVPVSIKDLLLTRGWPTLRGSRTSAATGPWTDDAPATARLREHGAVLLGKTTTPEFGWKGVTDSPLTGTTRNPWNAELTPGGSSGGAAVAVAAGMGPLAVGTDGGGSVRIPSAFSGIVGLKPHFGRVPLWPVSPMGNVGHAGPMARSVADCALLLNVISQPDYRDATALPPHNTDWTEGLGDGVKGLRIAYSPRLGYVPQVDAEIEAAVARAAKQFARLGAEVEETDPGFADCGEAFRAHWFSHARNMLSRLPPEKFALLDPGLAEVVRIAERITLTDYLDHARSRLAMCETMRRFNQKYDLLLTPAMAVLPFAVNQIAPPRPQSATDWTWWTPFSFPFNMTQQPAIAVPCGFSKSGLPMSLQLVAPAWREDLALRAAFAFEQANDFISKWPDIEV
jgi:aspartyl-tRNA(Asn)/glutamyl-tRNA(Gln) amidotransferase subunit A